MPRVPPSASSSRRTSWSARSRPSTNGWCDSRSPSEAAEHHATPSPGLRVGSRGDGRGRTERCWLSESRKFRFNCSTGQVLNALYERPDVVQSGVPRVAVQVAMPPLLEEERSAGLVQRLRQNPPLVPCLRRGIGHVRESVESAEPCVSVESQ